MVNTLAILVLAAATVNASPNPQAPAKGSGSGSPPKGAGGAPKLGSNSGGISGLIGNIAGSFVTSGQAVPFGPAPKGCSANEILVARGTGEPGPFGTIVGDPLVSAVSRQVSGTRGYAVQYPANMNMTGSAPVGVADIIKRLNNQAKNCPQQKFALVGYSQGAAVMHGVFREKNAVPAEVIQKIVAVVMFGDGGFRAGGGGGFGGIMPAFPAPLDQRLKQNCAAGDPVCDPAGGGFENHIKYVGNPYQRESVTFIVAGFKGQKLPDSIKSSADPRWKGATPKAGGSGGKGGKGPAGGPPAGGKGGPPGGGKGAGGLPAGGMGAKGPVAGGAPPSPAGGKAAGSPPPAASAEE